MREQELSSPERPRPGAETWQPPLVLVAAAALLALIVTTLQLVGERNQLVRLRDAQAPRLEEANQFRQRLQAIGSETARLAAGGDATAKKIVDAMKQLGVTLQEPGK